MSARIFRLFVIAVISFLTLVDLFATQAILPSLARAYDVTPSNIGSAVNACTFGMAVAAIVVARFNHRIDRRLGVTISLILLAVPTSLLAYMPDLATFAVLRIVQGVFMSAAFSLTIAYLAENCSAEDAASALAAYVTGNVASNLVGRLVSAAIVDHLGLSLNFVFFAGLNLSGAALAYFVLRNASPMIPSVRPAAPLPWIHLFRRNDLIACFVIGFLILFTFIGTFTYVNFLLTGSIGLSAMQLGFVYFVFVPSIIATPFAGSVARRFGVRPIIISALAAATLGLPFLAWPALWSVLLGLVLVAAGTFFAQATATGYVSRASSAYRGAAGGIYLASYYSGGLAGSFVLGRLFDQFGWNATVLAIGLAFAAAAFLAFRLSESSSLAHSTAISK